MSEELIENIVKDIIKENINSGINVYDIEKLDNIDTDPVNDDKSGIVDIKSWSPIQSIDTDSENDKKPKIKREKKEVKTFKQRCLDDPEFYKKTKDRLKEKVVCDVCRCEISKSSVSEHRLTKRHLRNVEHESNNIQIKKVNKLLELMEKLTSINREELREDIKDNINELVKEEIPKNKSKPSSVLNAEKARLARKKKLNKE